MTAQLPAAPRAREPVFRHPWRVVVVVAVLLVVASLGAVVLDSADTSRPSESRNTAVRLGAAVESVNPEDGEILQDAITADLRNDLTGVLVIDGIEVPEDQTDRVEPLGQVSFRPGPGKDIVRFEPKRHRVAVLYWEQGKRRPAHPGGYTWTFRSVS
jgi:hypothetical protein